MEVDTGTTVANIGERRLPAGVRRYAQGRVYRHLHEMGPGPYDAATVRPVLQRLETELGSSRQVASV